MKAKLWFLGGIEIAIAAMYFAPYELGLKIFFAIVIAAGLAIYKLAPRRALAATLAGFVLLIVVGVVSVYAVPGISQVAKAKDSLNHWSDQQSRAATCAEDCARRGQNAGAW